MKKHLLLVLCAFFIVSFGKLNATEQTIHGDGYFFLGSHVNIWEQKGDFEVEFPVFSSLFYGNKYLFIDHSFRLTIGAPSTFEMGYGFGINVYPFKKIFRLSSSVNIGTFLFTNLSFQIKPEVAFDIPVGPNSYFTLGAALPFKFYIYYLDDFNTKFIRGYSAFCGFTFKN